MMISKEEKTILVPKFTRPEVEEKLTTQNIKDIIKSQENAIKCLEKELSTKEECVKHYKKYL